MFKRSVISAASIELINFCNTCTTNDVQHSAISPPHASALYLSDERKAIYPSADICLGTVYSKPLWNSLYFYVVIS